MEPVQRVSPLYRQAWVVSGVSIHVLCHGCLHAYPTLLLPRPRHPNPHLHLSNQTGHATQATEASQATQATSAADPVIDEHMASLILFSLVVTGVLGNLSAPLLSCWLGRRRAHLAALVPLLLGWAVFAVADAPWLFVAARLLHGASLGLRTPIASNLVAEYSSPAYRGAFLGSLGVLITLGMFLTHTAGAYLHRKTVAVMSLVIAAVSLAIVALSVESPSWLASKGRFEEAARAFRWLRGRGDHQELSALIKTQTLEREKHDRKISVSKLLKQTFTDKLFYKPFMVSLYLNILVEFGGFNYFMIYIYDIVNAFLVNDSIDDHVVVLTVDLTRFIATFLSVFIVKRFKRRVILFTTGILTVLVSFLLALFKISRRFDLVNNESNVLPVALLIAYIFCFTFGPVSLFMILAGEIFPLRYKVIASTISYSIVLIFYVIVLKTFSLLSASVGLEGVFIVYGFIFSVGLFSLYWTLPETKDKILPEIECFYLGVSLEELVEAVPMNPAATNMMEKS